MLSVLATLLRMAGVCFCPRCCTFRTTLPHPSEPRWASLSLLEHAAELQPRESNNPASYSVSPIHLWTADPAVPVLIPYAFRCRLCHRRYQQVPGVPADSVHAFAWVIMSPDRFPSRQLQVQCEVCTILEVLRLRWVEEGQCDDDDTGDQHPSLSPRSLACSLWELMD